MNKTVKRFLVLGALMALVACGVCIIVALMPTSNQGRGEAVPRPSEVAPRPDSATPRPTPTPRPTVTPVPPTATLSPEGAVYKVARDRLSGRLASATLSTVSGKAVASIKYNLPTLWDETDAASSALEDLRVIAPKIFEGRGVDILELASSTTFKDSYGNEANEVAFKFTVTRALAGKVNWQSVEARSLGYVVANEGGGSGVYVHPALRSAWELYINR